MDTIFMNYEKKKTNEPNRLLLDLSHKVDLKGSDKHVALSNLSMCYGRKNIKNHTKTINLKYKLLPGMKHLNYLMDQILYQTIEIISNVSLKNMKHLLITLK